MKTLRQRESFFEHHRPMVARSTGMPKLFESPTFTCKHCNRVVIMNPDRSRPRGYCRKCDAYVCDNPLCNSECNGSFSKFLDELEAKIIKSEQNQTTLIIPDVWGRDSG